MAQARGNQGFVMFSTKQTTFGTKATPTITGSIQPGEDLREVSSGKAVQTDAIRNSESPTYQLLGRKTVEGGMTFEYFPGEVSGLILAMVLGANNTVTGSATTGYNHTFNASSGCLNYPESGVTIQKFVGGCGSAMLFDFVSCFADTFTLTIPEDGVITYQVGFRGVKSETAGTKATPSYSTVAPFEGWMAHIEVGSVIGSTSAIKIKDATLTISNNIQMLPDRNASSRYMTAVSYGSRTVELSFSLSQEDNLTLYNYAKNDTVNAMKLVLTHPSLAGSSSGVYSLTFNLPMVTWLGDEPTLDSADQITGSYNVSAMRDPVTGYQIQAIEVNATPGTYSV